MVPALLAWLCAGCGDAGTPLAQGSFVRIVAQTSDGHVILDDGKGTVSAVALADGSSRVVLRNAPATIREVWPRRWINGEQGARPAVFLLAGPDGPGDFTVSVWSAAFGIRSAATLAANDRLDVAVSADGRYVAYVQADANANPKTYRLVIDTPELVAPKVGPAWTSMRFQFVGNRLIVAWSAADQSSGLSAFDPATGGSIELAHAANGPFIVSPDQQRVGIADKSGVLSLIPLDGSAASVLVAPGSALPADGGVVAFLADGSVLYQQKVPGSRRQYINRVRLDGQPQRLQDPSDIADDGAVVIDLAPDRRHYLLSQVTESLCRTCSVDLFLADADQPGVATQIPPGGVWFTSDSSHMVFSPPQFECSRYQNCTNELFATPANDVGGAHRMLKSSAPGPQRYARVVPLAGAEIVFSGDFTPRADGVVVTGDIQRVDLARDAAPTTIASGVSDFVVTPDRNSVVYLRDAKLYRVALSPTR
jgi:hypothetical protein